MGEIGKPGIGGKPFSIVLNHSWFCRDTILPTGNEDIDVVFLTGPEQVNNNWYAKLIHRLTFGWLCAPGWKYNVQLLHKKKPV